MQEEIPLGCRRGYDGRGVDVGGGRVERSEATALDAGCAVKGLRGALGRTPL